MKCLSIQQPFAHLIVTPQAELPAGIVRKRVENRVWKTDYRGPLLIHAGMSKSRLCPTSLEKFQTMAFGAIVGMAELVDCVPYTLDGVRPEYFWLHRDPHTEGPWCWILEKVKRVFGKPIPYKGRQRLFDVPCEGMVAGDGIEPNNEVFLSLGEHSITDLVSRPSPIIQGSTP